LHNAYREKIKFLRESLDVAGADLKNIAEKVFNFTIHWLANHIMVVDKGYSGYVYDPFS